PPRSDIAGYRSQRFARVSAPRMPAVRISRQQATSRVGFQAGATKPTLMTTNMAAAPRLMPARNRLIRPSRRLEVIFSPLTLDYSHARARPGHGSQIGTPALSYYPRRLRAVRPTGKRACGGGQAARFSPSPRPGTQRGRMGRVCLMFRAGPDGPAVAAG